MGNRIVELINLVQKLSVDKVDIAIEAIEEIIKKPEPMNDNCSKSCEGSEIIDTSSACNYTGSEAEQNKAGTPKTPNSDIKFISPLMPCPHCKSSDIVRYGKMGGQRRFRCKSCKKTYVATTQTALQASHYGEAVWKQLIDDTICGKSLDKTAADLKMSHATAFAMRHKLLIALEDRNSREPTSLSGVCELDETYVLESLKGTKIPEDYWRGARRHGAKAIKSGISKEYVCCCTGVQRNGDAVAQAVNRSVPKSEDLKSVFEKHIAEGSHLLYDGLRSYIALGVACKSGLTDVFDPACNESGDNSFYNINTANAFHSQIKGRYHHGYRAVATKYLNRYNALFATMFRKSGDIVDQIYKLLTERETSAHVDCGSVKKRNLLDVGVLIN